MMQESSTVRDDATLSNSFGLSIINILLWTIPKWESFLKKTTSGSMKPGGYYCRRYILKLIDHFPIACLIPVLLPIHSLNLFCLKFV